MKAFWKFILVKDIAENLVEQEPEVVTEEELEAERETGIPPMQPNVPDQAFARLVRIVSVGEECPKSILEWMKIYVPHYAGDVIDEGLRIIGINSVLAIEE